MKLWNKIKQIWRRRAEREEKIKVLQFMLDGDGVSKRLKNISDRLAYKRKLTATYTYQEGDDLLARKQDFIEQYTVNEKQQLNYFTQFLPEERSDFARCKAWRDHEQEERREAQKAWCVVQHRNHREHMRQKYMNQKTR